MLPRLLFPFLAIALLPGALAAQAVRGVLVERGTDRPVIGALVSLLDDEGERRGSTLTDAAGRFVLRAPFEGEFTLRAERVGYAATVSQPFPLQGDDIAVQRLEDGGARVSLAGVRASAECAMEPDADGATAAVWGEARKALAAVHFAVDRGLVDHAVELFARRLRPGTLEVVDERREARPASRLAPAAATAAELARNGFVRARGDSLVYEPLTPAVLLSPHFVDSHCYRVKVDASRPTAVGLAFEPPMAGGRADVEGVLWLDRATARLQSLEYRYVRVPGAGAAGAGGGAEFEQTPDGRWVVSRWWVRTPRFAGAAGGAPGYVLEQGGEIAGGAVAVADRVAEVEVRRAVRGVVWDSLAGRPLAGAVVYVTGAPFEAVADIEGQFGFDDFPPGRHGVSFRHPVLEQWGLTPPVVEVPPGEAVQLRLGIPSRERLSASLCPPQRGDTLQGSVLGVVTRGGVPVAGARVRFIWRESKLHPRPESVERFVETVTDAAGFYVACGVSEGHELTPRVSIGRSVHVGRPVRAGERLYRHDIVVGR